MQKHTNFISILARQPILDRKKNTFAFELLYRSFPSYINRYPDKQDGTLATIKLIQSSMFLMGIEKVTGGKPAFINFTKESIIEGIPNILNPKHCVLEVLEDIEDSPELLAEIDLIKKKGFSIALDDFTLSKQNQQLIENADFIKIDVLATPFDEIYHIFEKFKDYNIKFLAEKVENNECFKCCKEMGFDYFQGFFFAKPEVLSCTDIPVSKLNMMNLLRIISKEDIDIKKTVSIIERDPGLTYKLLKLVNSAAFYFEKKINSLTHALLIIGEKEIRKWITIVALSNLIEDNPNELLITSCLRAKFCEYIAIDVMPPLKDEAFITGLLSLFDVILNMPMDRVLEELPLSLSIKDALLHRKGPLAFFLELVKKYEVMDVYKIALLSDKMRIEKEKLMSYYIESTTWANYFYQL
jgi:EAL and modified HD-GYP domain-containing signal transduction protein